MKDAQLTDPTASADDWREFFSEAGFDEGAVIIPPVIVETYRVAGNTAANAIMLLWSSGSVVSGLSLSIDEVDTLIRDLIDAKLQVQESVV